MAAGRKYEGKDKFECLQCFVLKSRLEASYSDECAQMNVTNSTKQNLPKNTCFVNLQAYSLS